MTCLARQHRDQMICHQCGLVWDVNDQEPPVCRVRVADGTFGKLGKISSLYDPRMAKSVTETAKKAIRELKASYEQSLERTKR